MKNLLLVALFLVLLGDGLGLAYMGGFFTGKNEVIENDRRITNLTPPFSTPSIIP